MAHEWKTYWITKTESNPRAIIDSILYNNNGEYDFLTMGVEHGIESFDENTKILTTVDGLTYINFIHVQLGITSNNKSQVFKKMEEVWKEKGSKVPIHSISYTKDYMMIKTQDGSMYVFTADYKLIQIE